MDDGSSMWSLWSQDSLLCIGSKGSVLSIGSIGSVRGVMTGIAVTPATLEV